MTHAYRSESLPPENFLAIPLTLNGGLLLGDATNAQMAVNASLSSPQLFESFIPAGKEAYLFHLHFVIVDGTMEPNEFGALSALGNGLKLEIINSNGGARHIFDAGLRVKTNSTWPLIAPGGVRTTTGGATDDQLDATWDMHGRDEMSLNAGDRVRVTVQDNLSAVTSIRCVIHVRLFNATE